jgi:hypothetical protein
MGGKNSTMLNFCRIVAAILKMVTSRNFSMSGINKTRHKKWAVKIQHCPISSKFDMWVHNDVPNLFPYQILMISDNVEFFAPIFYAVFWQPF